MSRARQPTQHRNSDLNSHGPGGFKYAAEKRAACDRCRGQKLRCIWDGKAGQCRRCAKANVVCMLLPPRSMGRPSRPTRRHDSQSKDNETQVPFQDPHWAEALQSQLLHAGSCAPMDQDDTDIQDTLTKGPGTDFDDTDGGITAGSSTDCRLNGQVIHFSSGHLPPSDMLHIDNNLLDLEDDPFSDYSSIMQSAIDSDITPRLCSDNTSDLSRQNDPTMNPSGPVTPQFVPPDLVTEGEDNMDEDLDDKDLSIITKLSRLNLALYKHLAQMNTGQYKSPSPVMTAVPLEPPSVPNPRPAMVPTGMIGRMLSLTDQFTTLLDELGFLARVPRAHDSGNDPTSSYGSMSEANNQGNATRRDRSRGGSKASRWKQLDPSTTLLVLSCYLHLRELHSRSRRVLEHVMTQDMELDCLPELMPNLIIEGFSLAGHGRLQLGMTAQLCEQMFSSIGPRLGLNDKVCDVAADGLDELVEKIWGLFERETSP